MEDADLVEMTITGVHEGETRDGYREVTLSTTSGDVECRYYPVSDTQKAVLFVGGIGGGFDTPARGLYPLLCEELVRRGIAALRVRFRHPTVLEDSTLDVLAGLTFLDGEGIDASALVGHSFGGAVVIQAAALDEEVRTVVTLAAQSHGAAPVALLGPRCSILLIHGTDDTTLPPSSSEQIYSQAREPKKLIILEDARHCLDEKAEEVNRVTLQWLLEELEGDST